MAFAYDDDGYQWDEGDQDEEPPEDQDEEPQPQPEPEPEPEQPSYEQPSYEAPSTSYDPGTGWELPTEFIQGGWGSSPAGGYGAPAEPQESGAYWPKEPLSTGTRGHALDESSGFELPLDFINGGWGPDSYKGVVEPDAPEPPTRAGPPDTWPDGRSMSAEEQRLARVYQGALDNGMDPEGARAMVAIAKTEGGLFGADGDNHTSFGPFQLHEGGELNNFAVWLTEQGIAGDPRVLARDIDLATRFAATRYLGTTIKAGQAQGVHGPALATYGQQHGQVSINPWKAGQNYAALFPGDTDPYGQVMQAAVPTRDRRDARSAAQGQPGAPLTMGATAKNPDLATPYTEQQVDKSGRVWEIAFDFDQKYSNPFNPNIPNHRGIDLVIPAADAEAQGLGKNGQGAPYTAFQNGVVAAISPESTDPHGGLGVIVYDPQTGLYSRYFHNDSVAVKPGDQVVAGQTVLGTVGQTGSQGFPHLHYEVSKNINGDPMGSTIDPRGYISQPVRRQGEQPKPVPPREQQQQADPNAWLDAHSKELLTDWQKMRAARGEDYLDTNEFRAHLGRLGAPDPWTIAAQQQQQAAAATARAQQQQRQATVATAAAAAPQAAQVPSYTVGGRSVSKAEYDAAIAQNADAERKNAEVRAQIDAHNAEVDRFYAQAQAEQAAIDDYGRRYAEWRQDTDAGVRQDAPPERPATPTLNQRLSGVSPQRLTYPTAEAPAQVVGVNYGVAPEGRGARTMATENQLQQIQQTYGVTLRPADFATPGVTPPPLAQAIEEQAGLRENQRGTAISYQIQQQNAFNQRVEEQSAVLRAQYGVETPLQVVRAADGSQSVQPTPELQAHLDREQQAIQAAGQQSPETTAVRPEHVNQRIYDYYIQRGYSHEQALAEATIPASNAPIVQLPSAGEVATGIGDILLPPEYRPSLPSLPMPHVEAYNQGTYEAALARGATPEDAYREASAVDQQALAQRAYDAARFAVAHDQTPVGIAANEALAIVGQSPTYTYTPRTTPTLAQSRGPLRDAIVPDMPYYEANNNAWVRGWVNAGTGMLDVLAEAARVHGQGDVAAGIQGYSDQIGSYLYDHPEVMRRTAASPWASPQALLEGTIEQAPSILPNVLGMFLGYGEVMTGIKALGWAGSAVARAGLLAGSMQQAGQQLQELQPEVQSGRMSQGTANILAAGGGIVEYLTERMFPGADARLYRGMGAETSRLFMESLERKGLVGVLATLGTEMAQEGAEEAVSQSYQEAVAQVFQQNAPTLAESIQNIASAAGMGAVAGGLLSGPSATLSAVHGALDRPRSIDEVTMPEGVKVTPVTPDWSNFVITVWNPRENLRPYHGLFEVAPNGEVRAVGNLTTAAGAPLVNTPQQAERANFAMGAVLEDLTRRGVLSPQAAERAQVMLEQSLGRVRMLTPDEVNRLLHPVEQPATAEGGRVVGEFPDEASRVEMPEGWQRPIPLGNQGHVITARSDADPRTIHDQASQVAYQEMAPVLTQLIQLGDRTFRGDARLPEGRRRPVVFAPIGGSIRAMSGGTMVRGPNGEAINANGITIDLPQILVDTVKKARKLGITDPWNDRRFLVLFNDGVMGTLGHEGIGHDKDRDHGAAFDAGMTAWHEAMNQHQEMLNAVSERLWESGELEKLYHSGLRALVRSPNENWQYDARTTLDALRAAGRDVDYPESVRELFRPRPDQPTAGAADELRARGGQPAAVQPVPGAGAEPRGGPRRGRERAAAVARGRAAGFGLPSVADEARAEEAAAAARRVGRQGPSPQVGEAVAARLPGPVVLPTDDPAFMEAVAQSGARIGPNGLTANVVRWQHPDQLGLEAARGGVHYLITGSPQERYYRNLRRTGETWYGGSERVAADHTIRRPLVVRGSTGGGAMRAAYDTLMGRRGAYEELQAAPQAYIAPGYAVASGQQLVSGINAFLRDYGGDVRDTYAIYQAGTDRYGRPYGNRIWTALTENVLAQKVREAGHDGVVAIRRQRGGGHVISEIFSTIEGTYPDETGRTELREGYGPQAGPSAEVGEMPPPPPAYEQRMAHPQAFYQPVAPGWPSQASLSAARSLAEADPYTWKDPYFSPEQIADALLGAEPRADRARMVENLRTYWPSFEPYLEAFGLQDDLQTRMALLGTIAVETGWRMAPIHEFEPRGGFESVYGPGTRAGRALGNIFPGDGDRFHGRGFIQVTGRANYERYGQLLGADLLADPDAALNPSISAAAAVGYFADRGIPDLARQNDWVGVRSAVNGGDNGLADFRKAMRYLAAAGEGLPVRGQQTVAPYAVEGGQLVYQGTPAGQAAPMPTVPVFDPATGRYRREEVSQLLRGARLDPTRSHDYYVPQKQAQLGNGDAVVGGGEIPSEVVARAAARPVNAALDTHLRDTYNELQQAALDRGLISFPGEWGGLAFSYDVLAYNVTVRGNRVYLGLWALTHDTNPDRQGAFAHSVMRTMAHELAHNDFAAHGADHTAKMVELQALADELDLERDVARATGRWWANGGYRAAIRDGGAAFGITRRGVTPEGQAAILRGGLTPEAFGQATARAAEARRYDRELARRWGLPTSRPNLSDRVRDAGDLIGLSLLDEDQAPFSPSDIERARAERDGMSMEEQVDRRDAFLKDRVRGFRRRGYSDDQIFDRMMDYGFYEDEVGDAIDALDAIEGAQLEPEAVDLDTLGYPVAGPQPVGVERLGHRRGPNLYVSEGGQVIYQGPSAEAGEAPETAPATRLGVRPGVRYAAHYPPGTPEAAVEAAARASAAASPDHLAHLTAADLEALPDSPFSRQAVRGKLQLGPSGLTDFDTLRTMLELGMPHRDWYTEVGDRARALVGAANLPEFFTLFGITSQQTKVHDNIAATLLIMRFVREEVAKGRTWAQIKKDMLDAGDQVQTTYKKDGVTKEGVPYKKGDGRVDKDGKPIMEYTRRPPLMFSQVTGEKRRNIVDAYENGESIVAGAAKTSSYAGNFESTGQRVFDPRTTNDVWVWRAINVKDAKVEGNAAINDKAYRFVEAMFNEIAREVGLPGHNVQAAVWATMKNLQEKAPDLYREWKVGGRELSSVLAEARQRTVDDNGVQIPLFDVSTGQAEDFDHAAVKTALGGMKPGQLLVPGPLKAATMSRTFAGLGAQPRPSNLAFRQQERAIEERRAPMAVLPITRQQLLDADLNTDTNTFDWLTVPHRVITMGDQTIVHLPGGTVDTATYVGGLLGTAVGSDPLILTPFHGGTEAVGLGIHGTPEAISALADDLAGQGIPHALGTVGTSMQVPYLDGDEAQFLGTIQKTALDAGIEPDGIVALMGEARHVAREDYARDAGALRNLYSARGRSALQGRSLARLAGRTPELEPGVTGDPDGGTADPARLGTVQPNQPDGPQPGDLQGPSADVGEAPDDFETEVFRAPMSGSDDLEEEMVARNRGDVLDRYSGDMGQIVVKEVVQNSVDASRQIAGAHTQVDIYPAERRIVAVDQGTGMTREIVRGAFTKYRASHKPDPSSSGGKGTAKSAILGRAAKVEMRTVALRPNGQLEEVISWGTNDEYIRPSQGLYAKAGPYGWVDEAIRDGTLPEGSLTQPELLAPWKLNETPNGTGTRLSMVVEDSANWTMPTGSTVFKSPIENWMTDFMTSNHIEGQTVGFAVDQVPYVAQLNDPTRRASILAKSIDGPTWSMDIYISEAQADQPYVVPKVQNQGLYQISPFTQIPEPTRLPVEIIVNVKSKVGANEAGYPWTGDRDKLTAGADVALNNYILNELVASVVQGENAKIHQAIESGVPIKGSSGQLLNVGGLEGDDLAALNRLADRPYLQAMARGLEDVHDLFEAQTRGKTWGSSSTGTGTFGTSAFGGFGASTAWIGLNVPLRGLHTRYGQTNYLILFDPWYLVESAVYRTQEAKESLVVERGAEKRAPIRRTRQQTLARVPPRAALRFDPYANLTVTDHYGTTRDLSPEDVGWEVRYPTQQAAYARSQGNTNLAEIYGREMRPFQQALDQYLRKLGDWQVARAIYEGEQPQMIDPMRPKLRPTDLEEGQSWYGHVYGKSPDEVYGEVNRAERALARAETDEDRTRAEQDIAEQRRIYDWNRAIEDRILKYHLTQGMDVEVQVGGNTYHLDQNGIDEMAYRVERTRERAAENADSDQWNADYYAGIAARYEEGLARFEALTGLTHTPIDPGSTGVGVSVYDDIAGSARPFSEEFLVRLEGQLLAVEGHEITHNAVGPHNNPAFSRVLTEVYANIPPPAAARIKKLVRQMAKDGTLRDLFSDMGLYHRLRSAENVFGKIGVEYPGEVGRGDLGEAGTARGADRYGPAPERAPRGGGLPAAGRGGGVLGPEPVQRAQAEVPGAPVDVRGLRADGGRALRGPSADVGEAPAVDPFYSQLERTITTRMPNRATARQVEGILKGTVKEDELVWSGFKDWLAAQGDRPVSKADALSYLTANNIRVQEVVYGGGAPIRANDVDLRRGTSEWYPNDDEEDFGGGLEVTDYTASTDHPEVADQEYQISHDPDAGIFDISHYDPQDGYRHIETVYDLAEAEDAIYEHAAQQMTGKGVEGTQGPTQWDEPALRLPGGENYRELLLTLPQRMTDNPRVRVAQTSPTRWRVAEYGANGSFSGYVSGEYASPEQAVAARETYLRDIWETQGTSKAYRGAHWDTPNVLAHVRFDERTDAQGRRLLFIDELQSDWHQAGRKHGYRTPETDPVVDRDALREEKLRLQNRNVILNDRATGVFQALEDWARELEAEGKSYDEVDRMVNMREGRQVARRERQQNEMRISEIDRILSRVDDKRVPPAPFEKNWSELAFKRIVRWAAEHGYDAVGWTPGEVQAPGRYGTERLSWTTAPDGTFQVTARPQTGEGPLDTKRGESGSVRDMADLQHLLARAGFERPGRREIAEQRTTADQAWKRMQASPEGVYEPRVEGMAGFYDRVLPSYAAKLGKPFGATVSRTVLPGEDRGVQFSEPGWVVENEQNGEFLTDMYTDPDAAERKRDEMNRDEGPGWVATPTGPVVHVMDITPEMKHSVVTKGQPLFDLGEVPDMPMTTPEDRARAAAQRGQAPTGPEQLPLWDNRGNPLIMPIGDPDGLPDDDPYIRLDPDQLAMMDLESADFEANWPDEPPRTDDVAQAVAQLPPPPPSGPREYTRNTFPSWAHGMLDLGELASTRTTIDPDTGEVVETPTLPENPTSEVMDVHETIVNGPNRQFFTDGDVDALRNAILLQWNRLVDAATTAAARGTAEDVVRAATRTLEQSRRYSALMGLAMVPREQWGVLENVWKSQPISEGRDVTEDTTDAITDAMIQRAEALLARSPRIKAPGTLGIGKSTRNARVVQAADAIHRAITGVPVEDLAGGTPARAEAGGGQGVRRVPVSPSGIAHAMTMGDDLRISPVEVLQAMTYNNMLIGPRGIQVDYVSDAIQLMLKALTDPLLPRQGGWDLRARRHISQAEMLAVHRYWGAAMRRASRTILDGVDDVQATSAGIPRTMSGKLTARMQDLAADAARLRSQAAVLERNGRAEQAAAKRREADGLEGRRAGVGAQKVLAIGFGELAGRLKSVADVSIRQLAWGMEQTRQAAIYVESLTDHPPTGSKEWYQRVWDAVEGRGIDPILFAEMTERSTREAERVVFQGQMGTIGRYLEVVQRNPIGSIVLPFLRALYHIRGWAVDLSPLGLAVTTGDVLRAQIPLDNGLMRTTRNLAGLAGGPYKDAYRGSAVGPAVAPLDRRLLYNVIGTAAFFALLGYAFKGGISGGGPPDQPIDILEGNEEIPGADERALKNLMYASGWRPYSIYVKTPWGRGYWLSYAQWGPFAYLLSAAAAIAETQRYGLKNPTRDPDLLTGLGELATQGDAETVKQAGRRFFGVVEDVAYLQNLVDLYRLARNEYYLHSGGGGPPGEGPGSKIRRERRMREDNARYVGNIVTRFLPVGQLLSTIAASQDPYERATGYGSIKEQVALRLPEPWLGIGPDAGRFVAQPGIGSETGRRQGLPAYVDALGRPEENLYGGIYAYLPMRASREDLSSPSVNALMEARVGVPSPPSELIYRVGNQSLLVYLTPRMRQQIGTSMGQLIDQRVQRLLAETPEARRAADPEAWRNRLADTVSSTYLEVRDAYRKDPDVQQQWLQPLSQDSDRLRPFDPKVTPTPEPGVPSIGPPDRTPTPRATPTPSGDPNTDVIRRRGSEVTPAPRPTQGPATATPRAGAAPGPPTATPRPIATPSGNPAREIIRSR